MKNQRSWWHWLTQFLFLSTVIHLLGNRLFAQAKTVSAINFPDFENTDDMRFVRTLLAKAETTSHRSEAIRDISSFITQRAPLLEISNINVDHDCAVLFELLGFFSLFDSQTLAPLNALMMDAIHKRHTRLMQLIIARGFEVERPWEEGFDPKTTVESALVVALKTGDPTVVRTIVQPLLRIDKNSDLANLRMYDKSGVYRALLRHFAAIEDCRAARDWAQCLELNEQGLKEFPGQLGFIVGQLDALKHMNRFNEMVKRFKEYNAKMHREQFWKIATGDLGILLDIIKSPDEITHPATSKRDKDLTRVITNLHKAPLITSAFASQKIPEQWFIARDIKLELDFRKWLGLSALTPYDIHTRAIPPVLAHLIDRASNPNLRRELQSALRDEASALKERIATMRVVIEELEREFGPQLVVYYGGFASLYAKMALDLLDQTEAPKFARLGIRLAQLAYVIDHSVLTDTQWALLFRKASQNAYDLDDHRNAYLCFRIARSKWQYDALATQVNSETRVRRADDSECNAITVAAIADECRVMERSLPHFSKDTFAGVPHTFLADVGYLNSLYRDMFSIAEKESVLRFANGMSSELLSLHLNGLIGSEITHNDQTYKMTMTGVKELIESLFREATCPPEDGIWEFLRGFMYVSEIAFPLIAIVALLNAFKACRGSAVEFKFFLQGVIAKRWKISQYNIAFDDYEFRKKIVITLISIANQNNLNTANRFATTRCLDLNAECELPASVNTDSWEIKNRDKRFVPKAIRLTQDLIINTLKTVAAKFFADEIFEFSCQWQAEKNQWLLSVVFKERALHRANNPATVKFEAAEIVKLVQQQLLLHCDETHDDLKAKQKQHERDQQQRRNANYEKKLASDREKLRLTIETAQAEINETINSFGELLTSTRQSFEFANSHKQKAFAAKSANAVLVLQPQFDSLRKEFDAAQVKRMLVDTQKQPTQGSELAAAQTMKAEADSQKQVVLERKKPSIDLQKQLADILVSAKALCRVLDQRIDELDRVLEQNRMESVKPKSRSSVSSHEDDDGDAAPVAHRKPTEVKKPVVAAVTESSSTTSTEPVTYRDMQTPQTSYDPFTAIPTKVIPGRVASSSSSTTTPITLNKFFERKNDIIKLIRQLEVGITLENHDRFYALCHALALFNQQLQTLLEQNGCDVRFKKHFTVVRDAFRHQLHRFLYEHNNHELLTSLRSFADHLEQINSLNMKRYEHNQATESFAQKCKQLLETPEELNLQPGHNPADPSAIIRIRINETLSYLERKMKAITKTGDVVRVVLRESSATAAMFFGAIATVGYYHSQLRALKVAPPLNLFRTDKITLDLSDDDWNTLSFGDGLLIAQRIRAMVGHDYESQVVPVGSSKPDEVVSVELIAQLAKQLVNRMPRIENLVLVPRSNNANTSQTTTAQRAQSSQSATAQRAQSSQEAIAEQGEEQPATMHGKSIRGPRFRNQ